MATSTKKKGGIDLAKLFQTVTSALADNRAKLDAADTYNSNHGSNMVDIFNTIVSTIKKNKTASQSTQLASASKALKNQTSGSAQLYAQGLALAAKQFKGKQIAPDNAGQLLQALMGASGAKAPAPQPASGGGDLLGSLLSSLSGSQPSGGQAADSGLDIGDLLNAGMSYMSAKQSGQSDIEAIVGALISASPMGQSDHRAQSGALVANTLMQVVGALTKKK